METTIDQAMQIAVAHHQAGRWALAEEIYRQVLTRVGDHPDALHLLGLVACQRGDTGMAIDLIRRAIVIEPAVAEYHANLGENCRRAGQLEEAIVSFRRAIELRPNLAEAHQNLGHALKDMGRRDEAIDAYRRSIQIMPQDADVHSSLGLALSEMGLCEEAITVYHRAIGLNPDNAVAYYNLGNLLRQRGELDEAIGAYNHAIRLAPADPVVHYKLGIVLRRQGHLDLALVSFDRAIELEPAYADAHNNLGGVLRDQGRLDGALESFRKAVLLNPDFAEPASNTLLTLHYHPNYTAQAILEEHRVWAERCADSLAAETPLHHNDRSPDRRLRIGFLTPDLRDHPVGPLLIPLFSHHDRRQTEIVCYSEVRAVDGITGRLEALADRWQSTAGLNDDQVADRIRDDQIDILVDMALHTAGNRLLVFARKPAPVQVTMLGMPATTGLAAMDYRLTDPYLDPPGASDSHYTEQSIRLPHCYWCYQPPEESPRVGELPVLKNGFVTFGCLNDFAKASPPALQLWVDILRALPAARLVIQSHLGSHRDAFRALFREGGIAGDRIEFVARVPRLQYLHRYLDLDLGLDPFPYNGHTSTLDSLWMGVPVVTLAGRTAVGRGGVSILSNLGLSELIARTPQEYVDRAVAWASDRARLAQLRAGLRQRLRSSVLMDGPRYAADVEAAFRRMWQTWCDRGDDPA